MPPWAEAASFAFLAGSFYIDARITVSNREFLKYESNILFRFLLLHLGPRRAVIAQAVSEVLLLCLAGLILGRVPGLSSLAAASQVFGLGHIFAWLGNRRFASSASRQGS